MKRDLSTWARGTQVHTAKLDEGDVIEIIDLLEYRNRLRKELESLTNEAIGRRYGVGKNAIRNIDVGKTWRHV